MSRRCEPHGTDTVWLEAGDCRGARPMRTLCGSRVRAVQELRLQRVPVRRAVDAQRLRPGTELVDRLRRPERWRHSAADHPVHVEVGGRRRRGRVVPPEPHVLGDDDELRRHGDRPLRGRRHRLDAGARSFRSPRYRSHRSPGRHRRLGPGLARGTDEQDAGLRDPRRSDLVRRRQLHDRTESHRRVRPDRRVAHRDGPGQRRRLPRRRGFPAGGPDGSGFRGERSSGRRSCTRWGTTTP